MGVACSYSLAPFLTLEKAYELHEVPGVVVSHHSLTHSALRAPVNSTCYIKKIVNCAIKQSGQSPPQSVVKCI